MASVMVKDLTKGNVLKNLLLFALPILIGLVIQQLYNMVDSIVVGHFIGEDAIAAIGTTTSINGLIINLGAGSAAGFAIVIAQKFGAKDYDGIKKSVGNAITLSLIICIILTVTALSISKPLLHLINVPDSIFQWAADYINWIYIGIVTIVFYNLITAILRALGNSLAPLIFLIMASLLNVGLDILFVGVFRWGVGSAALATVISQAFSGILSFVYGYARYPMIRAAFHDYFLEKKEALKQLSYGLPMGAQFTITSIGVIAVQGVINSFATPGDNAIITAFAACVRVEAIMIIPFWGLGAAMASFMGQNYGAKNEKGLREGVRDAVLISAGFYIFCAAFLMIFGKQMIYLFVENPSESLLQYSAQYFRIIPPFYLPLAMILIFRNSLQGMGDSLWAMLGGVLELVLRFLVAFALAPRLGYIAVYISNPITWSVTGIAFVVRYYFFMRKTKRKHFFALVPEKAA